MMAKITTRLKFTRPNASALSKFNVLIPLTFFIASLLLFPPIATMGQSTGFETTLSVPKLTPTITVSKTTLNFEKVYTGYHSLPQSYNVTGTNLTEAIVVTAPSGVEITKTCGTGYVSSISLTPTAGSVSVTIYARYNGGAITGSISHTHAGASTMDVTISETANSTNLPATYYNAATGTGATLKTQLYNIIKTHTTVSYDNLWTAYATTDKKPNGKIWDMYSDGDGCLVPAYEFTYSSGQCGSYSNEGDCYNREHSMPKSWFNDASPMYSDLFHIVPTDGKVNGMRSNYPFGVVASPTYSSTSNGSKLGLNTYGGTYSGIAFEPNDAYKGDFARNYFYMATCYENVIANWETNDVSGDAMLDGLSYPCFEPWALQMLLEWNAADPVDQKEKSRNDAVYSIQGNRNPYIDNPNFVNLIWGSTPTLSVIPSTLNGFTYSVGNGPSTTQSFVLSGANLTGFTSNITVTAPANFEVSTDGTNFATSKTVSYTSATLANTTIYVRLKTALAVNTYTGNITLTGGGDTDGASVSVSGSVTAIIPTLNTSVATLSGFTYVIGAGPSAEKNFTLSGVNLTGFTSNITVTAPANYEVSLASGGTFASTATIPYTSATLAPTTIYLRLASGLAVGSYTGNVTITGGGDADGASVALTGNVSTNTSSACLSESFTGFTAGTHAVPGSTDLAASLDTYTQTTGWSGLKIFPAAGEIKLGSSTALGYIVTPAVDLSSGGSVTFDIQVYGTDTGKVQVFHAPDGVNFTQVGSNITPPASYLPQNVTITGGTTLSKIKIGTNAKRVYLDNVAVICGNVPTTATLTVDPSSLSLFSYALGAGPSASQLYTLSGSDLTGFPSTITVTAPANYEVSLSLASGYGSSVAVPYTEATLTATPIYVRLKAGLTLGNYNSEIITHAGGGATTVNVTCSGSVTPAPVLAVSPTTLTGFNYVFGAGPSVAQNFTLSGANLVGYASNIDVIAPTNYEICLTAGGTYTSSLNIPYTTANLSSTLIYVRLKAGLPIGDYNSENISISGGGATVVNVTCSGSVTSTATPSLLVSPNSLTGFNYIFGAGPSTAQSYTLSGSNLTGFPSYITVTAPANYEICLSVGGTYTSSLNVAYSSASFAATTIYVRLKASLAVGTYNSQIVANAGGGATTTNATCSGSVNVAPTLIISQTTLTGFNYIYGTGPSTTQSYTLSGSDLNGTDVTITPSVNYEVSFTTGTGFTNNSLVLPAFNGTSTPIYIRLKAGLAAGIYNTEIISNTGGGATAVNVTCSGDVMEDISISEVVEKFSVNVYPNPFNNILTVHFSEIEQEMTVVLIDVIGKTVIREQRINSNKLELNTTSLAPGVYTLKVKSNGTGKVIKVVKR